MPTMRAPDQIAPHTGRKQMKPKFSTWMKWVGAAALSLGAFGTLSGVGHAADKKFKIFLSMSYIGNDWQAEAANMVKAMPPPKVFPAKAVSRAQVLGPNAQRQ